ncbi:MAG TPA: TIM barrel protein [Casimicrobiaceae bacterium]|nr:TIM barrel protein [Casimicrobiaceae bacterium]
MNFNDFGIDTVSLAGSLESRLASARQAGFTQIMISAADIVGHPSGAAGAVRAVREAGLRVTGLEALRDFEGLTGQLHAYKLDVAKSMLEVCSQLGGSLLLVEASTSTHANASLDAIARDLRKLAVLAIPMGIRIAYKGLSWSRTVKDFSAAGEVVFRADCPNLGVAIDAFDVIASGVPLDDLEGIDPDEIFLVQLSDYLWPEIRSAEEQAATATHSRVFPGEGAHSEEIAKLITKLDEIGYYGDYSFDVYNDDFLQMPPEAVADRARRAAEWLGETVLRRSLPVPNMERLRRAVHD